MSKPVYRGECLQESADSYHLPVKNRSVSRTSSGCYSKTNTHAVCQKKRLCNSPCKSYSLASGCCLAEAESRLTVCAAAENLNDEDCMRGGCSVKETEGCNQMQEGKKETSDSRCAPNTNRSESRTSGCCPKTRPVCEKKRRCNSPCKADSVGCGAGGCCGGGCRGGCGKPGQSCMSVKTCSGSAFYNSTRWSLPNCDIPPSPSKTQSTRQESVTFIEPTNCKPIDVSKGSACRSKSGCECLGGGVNCQRCGRKVYQAEMMIAAGSSYHNICFSCCCCRKPLEPLTYQEHCGEIYCKQCLIRNFGPQGYGYGIGAGALQTPV